MEVNVNKNEENKIFNWSVLFIVSLASVITGSYREGFSALFPFLQRDFDLTRAQLGLHSSLFFFTSAIIGIFTGRLVDLKGSKWSLFFGALSMGIFGIIEWFPLKWQSTALGILSTAFPMGGMLAATILPFLGGLIGWRKTILFPGVLAILYAFFILYFYQNKREEANKFKGDVNNISFWIYFSQLINVSILGFFLGAASGSIGAHFTLFLYLDYGLTETIAGLGFAVVQLGSILGRPVWGLISDRLLGANKRKTFLYIGILFTSLSLIFGIFLRNFNPPIYILFLLAFFTGFSGRGWQGLYFVSIAETVKEEQVGISIGYSLLFIRLGIMLAPPIFGYIADIRGTYNFSWLLLGFMILLTTVGQYLFYIKARREGLKIYCKV